MTSTFTVKKSIPSNRAIIIKAKNFPFPVPCILSNNNKLPPLAGRGVSINSFCPIQKILSTNAIDYS
jgi:hypothetical protein